MEISADRPTVPCKISGAPSREGAPERWPSGLRRTLGKRVCGKPYRGFESHSLRQYIVLHCSWSFELHNKISDLRQRTVLRSSWMFFLIGSLTVDLARGFGGRFSWRNNGWKAQTTRGRAPNQARQIRRWRWALLDRHRTNIEELVVQILEGRQRALARSWLL